MSEGFRHKTVLLDEAVDSLNVRPDGMYVDCTFGRGGHSRLILEKLARPKKSFGAFSVIHIGLKRNVMAVSSSKH